MKILVIGDACQDQYIYGSCERLCPAAPVPVFVPRETINNRGMAGNVYENLRTLGISCDLICNSEMVTKARYVDFKTNQMLLRVDNTSQSPARILNLDSINFSSYEAIVISDYDKGFLLQEDIVKICSKHPLVIIDTKKLISDWAASCQFIKINDYEYEKSKHLLDNKKEWAINSLIVTKGSDGCEHLGINYPVEEVEIRDLCGAGDTFLAGFIAEYIHTRSVANSIVFANQCATEVVQRKGVSLPQKFKGKFKK